MPTQLVILSGKGGTGKTSVTAALAQLAASRHRLVLVDADVDASNLGLLLAPEERERHPYPGGETAFIDGDRCESCGACAEVCRFDAIGPLPPYRVDPIACEGCRSCVQQCPGQVISMQPVETGVWLRSETRLGPLFHAEQSPGHDNTGKLVTTVRRAARQWAEASGADLVLIDGPPGIGCPVIAASTGVQAAVLVVEPSLSAIHDLRRVAGTVHHFGITTLACVNKVDLSPQRAAETFAACDELGIEIVGRIPFDPAIPRAIIAGRPVTELEQGAVHRSLAEAWNRIERVLAARPGGDMRLRLRMGRVDGGAGGAISTDAFLLPSRPGVQSRSERPEDIGRY